MSKIIEKIIKDEKDRQNNLTPGLDLLWSFGSNDENAHSAVISYLLDSKKEYLEYFLSTVGIKDIDLTQNIKITTEHLTDKGRRIDIFIEIGKDTCIIIENKIWAKDQPNQLHDYYHYAKDEGKFTNIHTLYLTLDGKDPSADSLSKNPDDNPSNDLDPSLVQKISYKKDILNWLKNIYATLDYNNEEHKLLKSALEQYMVSIKTLTNQNENTDKTQALIMVEVKNYDSAQLEELIRQEIPELVKIRTILKCIDVYNKCDGKYIASYTYFENLTVVKESIFDKSVPYFMGVLLEDKMIVFLNDGYGQYQIHKVEMDKNNIKSVGMIKKANDLDYLTHF